MSMQGNDKIREYTPTGATITTWGGPGSTDGLFLLPTEIALDAAEDVYVVDELNDRVQRFGFVPLAAEPRAAAPSGIALSVHPNPSRGEVRFEVSSEGVHEATVTIVDLQGRIVRRLAAIETRTTAATLVWDGRGASGARMAPGVYLALAQCGDRALTRRVLVLR
jgi:hypothetical protein